MTIGEEERVSDINKEAKCQRIQLDTFPTSRMSSLSKRAKICTALSVYKICGSCPVFPAKPPAQKNTTCFQLLLQRYLMIKDENL